MISRIIMLISYAGCHIKKGLLFSTFPCSTTTLLNLKNSPEYSGQTLFASEASSFSFMCLQAEVYTFEIILCMCMFVAVMDKIKHDSSFIKRIRSRIQVSVCETCVVLDRVKTFESVCCKLLHTNFVLYDMYDIIAFRILCPSVKVCYETLFVLQESLPIIYVEDYVRFPKMNKYRSIHVVCATDDIKYEIQIRSLSMEVDCVHGRCSHDMYKKKFYK